VEETRNELEQHEHERIAELNLTNERLMREIAERRKIEEELRKTN